MIFALLTAICWSFAGFASSRLARAYGTAVGNGLRLLFSTVVLLFICLLSGIRLWLPGQQWFALAGILHLTLGDIGLFAAYRRLGPRIGVLMVTSLAPATALLGEWILLGTTLKAAQLLIISCILILVIFAVAPKERNHLSRHELHIGILAGIFAAAMQGLSAVITRYGYTLTPIEISPWSTAFSRVAAATLGMGCWTLILRIRNPNALHRPAELVPHKKVAGHPALWMTLSVCLGPVIGVACLMKAFETTSSGLVQAIIATLPVFMIPVAWLLDGNIPSRRSVFAGCGAVGMAIGLIML
ncbi:DMT family transporter [Kiritimatiellaeota bacterium B1221]|nr:DMT family transporter [Kiritimatiellaeota bacterium B1221]